MHVIGTTTTYQGSEIPGLMGRSVRIFAVMRRALTPNVDVDAPEYFVTDDEVLLRLGGVTNLDRVDVAPVDVDGRVSFVHYDPPATDLACFAPPYGQAQPYA